MQIDYKKELNKEQYNAVTQTDGPVLIIAGAGSGKTRVLTYRVSYLIENGVAPEGILLLTFTNKAANEMKARAMQMLDERCKKITACTYHSFCAKLLRKYAKAIGYENNYTILDAGDMTDIVTMMKAELNYTGIKNFPNSTTIAAIISSSVNLNLSIHQVMKKKYIKYIEFATEVENIRVTADRYRKEHHMMNYDDILINFLLLLQANPNITKKIADTYSHIMVDEYQDSNYLQEQIVLELRRENKNLCVVGDDAQSIYGFRGSKVENILHYEEKMPGCKVIYLTMNYRSNQEIIDLSNQVMTNNMTEGYPKVMRATHQKYQKPKLIHTKGTYDEAEYIVEDIIKKHEEGTSYSDICVLFRSAYESYLVEELLTHNRIPYSKYGGIKFLEKSHIKDMLAYLRCVVNQKDEIAWFRILMLHWGIGKTYSRHLAYGIVNSENHLDVLLRNKYSKRAFQKDLNVLHDHMTQLLSLPFHEMMKEAVDFYMKLREDTIDIMNTDEDNREELRKGLVDIAGDLAILTSMTYGFDNPVTFLEELSLDMNAGGESSDENNTDPVILSTIHSAKGLEFDTVYVMNCVDKMFPSTTEADRGTPEDNEELRCFYVAITRAKEHLYLMVPGMIQRFNEVFQGILSHYLTHCLDLVS